MPVETQRLYERIAQQLASGIARGQYKVGQRLPSERELAQTFSVSRPTVREAIIALELDNLVEVRVGSGVYVTNTEPPGGKAGATDIGPFELLEARRSIEGEVCALAATRIDDTQLAELETLLEEMRTENEHDIAASEDADRRFHEAIAAATQNSGMIAVVKMLWDARTRSPQNRSLTIKVRASGYKPRIDEHTAILKALRERDGEAARSAMREHLTRVIEALLKATEIQELERARQQIAEQRKRYGQTK
ncbi:FadR/GntR family transcriptional regulator [Steroidobacter sp.]|uniref:FadR/GntR family transcriptional regulator n=1 Tax=Steroidobacter sp. TaxID=1978227 RepID=UPI001A5D3E31|nr:FadR/GntR family transcriptional regulator [Steroidobacter sp.]MBL8269461.1 FadR family transcriptional regulator [Steroidobacter sp.]